ncbi:MAG: hypothetical protein AAF499_14125, partial [Pseudomonadota bacterium]
MAQQSPQPRKQFLQRLVGVVVLILAPLSLHATDLVHVRLIDRLDRPDDGYCLDILGTPSSLRVDLPLFAHNCKGGPT